MKAIDYLNELDKGNEVAYVKLLIEDDREQLLHVLERHNPDFLKAYENQIKTMNNSDLAKFIVLNWKGGKLVIPKFKWQLSGKNAVVKDVVERLVMRKRMQLLRSMPSNHVEQKQGEVVGKDAQGQRYCRGKDGSIYPC